MKLGIHTNIFGAIWRGDEILPLREILPKICKIGYEGIELPLWSLAEEQINIEERKSLRSFIKDLGLELFAVGIYVNFTMKDKSQVLRTFKENAELAADLGARIVVTDAGRPEQGQSLEDALTSAIDGIQQCISEAENLSVKIGLETHGTLYNSEPILKIIKGVNSKYVGAVLDPVGEMQLQLRFLDKISETPLETVSKLGKNVIHVHFSDYRMTDGNICDVDPGEGNLNVQAFLNLLKEIGYSGNLCIEYKGEVTPQDPVARSREIYNKIRKYL